MGVLREIAANASGLAILAGLILLATLVFQWVAWIVGLGRFNHKQVKERELLPRPDRLGDLRYLITEAAVKIINDFRHLLALLFLLLFGGVLAFVLWHATTIAEMKEALLVVTSTIGVVLASIIGYYFGEARGGRGAQPPSSSGGPPPVIEQNRPTVPTLDPPPGIAEAPAPITDGPADDDPGDTDDHPDENDGASDEDPGEEEDRPGGE